MEYRKMGESGIELSQIGIGCWAMGGDYFGGADDADSIRTIHAALDLGVNFIDTAELYGDGHSEEIVGKALLGRRDKAVISTKVWTTNMRAKDLERACENSLKRLKTDYLDIYFIHYPPTVCGIEETMGAMLRLREQGKIREIGVSNFNAAQMEEALKIGRFEVIQPCHSLFWRFCEDEEIPFCQKHGIGVVTYSPLAQGLLTGKYELGHTFAPDDERKDSPLFIGENFERCVRAAKELAPIAQGYGKTTGQLAIAWDNCFPGVTSTIVGARNPEQIRQNTGGTGFTISRSDLAAMDAIGRGVTDGLPHYRNFFTTEFKKIN